MIENVSTNITCTFFTYSADNPVTLPEDADYTPFVQRLVDSYGDRSYTDWVRSKMHDYEYQLKNTIDDFN